MTDIKQDGLDKEVEKIRSAGGKAVGILADQADAESVPKVFDPMNLAHGLNPPEHMSTRPVLMSRSVRKYTAMPLDQAYAALFFASEMSNCVHGQVLTVDNGCFL